MSSRFGACVGITRVAVVFVRGVSVGLGFVWGKFQSLGFFGLLRVAVVFLALVWDLIWCWFRVFLSSHAHLGVYLGLRSKNAQQKKEAEQWRSREAE